MGAPTSAGAWKSQARALIRKNLRYQGRKGCENCCLIFLPLLFMGLLAVLQSLINDAISSAGLTCQDMTTVNATCGDTVSCTDGTVDGAYLMARFSQCTGNVADNDGQSCVYPTQIQNIVTGPSNSGQGWVTFDITNAMVVETCTGDASNPTETCELDPLQTTCPRGCDQSTASAKPMTQANAKSNLEATTKFASVVVGLEADIANARPRNLPFCPIAHPEPFPPFTLMPSYTYRTCNGGTDHPGADGTSLDCGTVLTTGGSSSFAQGLAEFLIPDANVGHAASVLLGSVDLSTLIAGMLGGGGGGGTPFSLIDPAALLSSDGQSTVMPQLADAMSGIALGTTAIPSSQLFLDNAFFMGAEAPSGVGSRRRLSHEGESSLNSGGGMMAMSTHCPTLVTEAKSAVTAAVCGHDATGSGACPGLADAGNGFDTLTYPQLELLVAPQISEGSLVPGVPLSCVNVTLGQHMTAASMDDTLMAGYRSDSIDAPNEFIQVSNFGLSFCLSFRSLFGLIDRLHLARRSMLEVSTSAARRPTSLSWTCCSMTRTKRGLAEARRSSCALTRR